ncbi:glycosyltransferase family 2 protein [Chlorobium phaeobacteroides]|uniref:Glycosyl transferase, family 2 n=1 Tax=Chlorobium phaeobacteroides (strain DSM 266 / SMG 266 / 2430) TaxID=290317 RepID=A1BHS1_CHLPD|nr:glycosyltransferase family 2 protein [Chlorobium phaeobacteroides]ABL65948.1 glycosyl transferase, family 2 [Chlorobium phaeobacteroides DSM 266]
MIEPERLRPAVDIIIPHFRGLEMLERSLESLEKTRYPSMGIIVVDNGGDQAGLVFLVKRFRNARLLRLRENKGYAGGCNEGLRFSSAEYLVFMNDDTEHDPFWLEHLVQSAEADKGIGALQPKILSLKAWRKRQRVFDYAGAAGGMIDRFGYPWCLGRNFMRIEQDSGQFDKSQEIFWASGVALFARRSVIEQVGGFDERFFMHMEEIDLCWRMKLAGFSIRSQPLSVVFHEGAASMPEGSAEKIFLNHRNNITMLLKNRGALSLLPVVSVRLFLEFAAALFYLMQGSGGVKKFRAVFRALRQNAQYLPETLSKRKLIQGSRKISDRELFRDMPFSLFLRKLNQFTFLVRKGGPRRSYP